VDDGIDSIDIEEIGQHEDQHGPVGNNFPGGAANPAQGTADQIAGRPVNRMDLADIEQDRQAESGPPDHAEQNRQLDRQRCADANRRSGRDQQDRQDERDGAATQIAHRKAPGRDLVHPVRGRDIGDEGIIEQK